MKKYLKILGVAIIFGGLLAYLFYYDINKEVRAISKKEEVITLFQVGVFKDYNNATFFSKTFPSSLIYKDNDYYRVIIAISYHEETKLKLESIYQNSEIEYYEKEIRINKDFIEKISNYESIILKSNKEEVINNVNNSILLFIFSGSINRFLIAINPNLDTKNIELNYDKYLKDELDNIKKINNIEFNDDLDLQVSRVKYRNVYEYSDTLTIYKGFKNSVFVNDVVLNNDGLIGIVTKTYDYYSIVTLITNKNSNISVKINDAIGILKTINNTLVVTNINNYEKVNVDDEIYTSGLGNLPDNIYIGKVKSINLNNTEIEKVVEVNINDRLEKLDYLFIRSNHD
mgnify:CR=1 FL=1